MLSVIIIDDETNIREGVRHMLQRNHPDINIIASADSVETGLEVIRQYQPDIVISDVNLIDGTVRSIIEQPDLPPFHLIIMTAASESKIKDLKQKAVKILFKPFTSDELSYAIEKAICK